MNWSSNYGIGTGKTGLLLLDTENVQLLFSFHIFFFCEVLVYPLSHYYGCAICKVLDTIKISPLLSLGHVYFCSLVFSECQENVISVQVLPEPRKIFLPHGLSMTT